MKFRVHDYLPDMMSQELLRVAKQDRNWMEIAFCHDGSYGFRPTLPTWLTKICCSGADAAATYAQSLWLIDGPKVFRPTEEQCDALERVEVSLELHDYKQPYQAVLVTLPDGKYGELTGVLACRLERMAVFVILSENHMNDVTTTVGRDGRPMEVSFQKYDEDVKYSAQLCGKVLRVAANACMALTNFGCHKELLYPRDVENDRRRADRGDKAASFALKLKPYDVKFDREVVLHSTEGGEGNNTGKEMPFHWRRGHWRKLESRTVFVRPCMVRRDKLDRGPEDTSATYRT